MRSRRGSLSLVLGVCVVVGTPWGVARADHVVWRSSWLQMAATTDVAEDEAGRIYATGVTATDPAKLVVGAQGRWRRTWVPASGADVCDPVPMARGEAVAVADQVVVVGGSVGGSCSTTGWLLRAYSAAGEPLWTRTQEGWRTGATNDAIVSVAMGGGLIVVAGMHVEPGDDPGQDGWLRAYSLDGREVWFRDFESGKVPAANSDIVTDVAIAADGSIYVTGSVERLGQVEADDPFDYEFVLQRLTSAGDSVWTRRTAHGDQDRDLGTSVATFDGWVAVSWNWYLPGHPDIVRVDLYTEGGERRDAHVVARLAPHVDGGSVASAATTARLYVVTGTSRTLHIAAFDASTTATPGEERLRRTWEDELRWPEGWVITHEGVAADDRGAVAAGTVEDFRGKPIGRLWRFIA